MISISPKTKRDLEGLLRILDDRGEEVLISYIKNVYLKEDRVGSGFFRKNRHA